MFSEAVERQIDVNRPKNGPVPGRPVNGYVVGSGWYVVDGRWGWLLVGARRHVWCVARHGSLCGWTGGDVNNPAGEAGNGPAGALRARGLRLGWTYPPRPPNQPHSPRE